MRHLGSAWGLAAVVLGIGATRPSDVVGEPGAAASLTKARQLIGASAVDPSVGPFVCHVTYDLAVSVSSSGAIQARVRDLRRCEETGSGVCSSDREGNGTTSLDWNFRKVRLWAEVLAEGLVATTDGPHASLQAAVVVHLEGLGNRHTSDSSLGDALPAHGPSIAVSGETNYAAREISFSFAEHPALAGIPKANFKPGAPDEGLTHVGYELSEPVIHSHLYRMRGDVRIRRHGQDAWEPAHLRRALEPLDQVAAFGEDAWAYLVLAPGVLSRLTGKTVLKVPGDALPTRVTWLELVEGVLWAKARKGTDEFRVATPNAICGVRGTSFEVQVLPGADPMTCVRVEEGAVETTAKDGHDTKHILTPADGTVCLLSSRGFLRTPTQPLTPPEIPTTPPVPAPSPPGAPTELVLHFPAGGATQDVAIAPGGTIDVLAQTHGGTGAKWAMAQAPNASVASLVSGPDFVPGKSTGRLGGGGGETRWRLRATGPVGSAFTAVFELRQPWNKQALSTYTLNARIASAAEKAGPERPPAPAGSPAEVRVELGATQAHGGVRVAPGATLEVVLRAKAGLAPGAWALAEPTPPAGAATIVEGPLAHGPGAYRFRIRVGAAAGGFLLRFAYRAANTPAALQTAHLGVAVAP